MQSTGGSSNKLLDAVNEAIGGHHGRFVDPDDMKKARRDLRDEPVVWRMLRETADSLLRKELLIYDLTSLPQPTNISNAIMAITGFTILCDWLGSDGRYFMPAPNTEFDEYLKESRKRAGQATHDSGMLSLATSDTPTDVETLFADLGDLRSLQLAINDIPDGLLKFPSLTIIEAPTGEGNGKSGDNGKLVSY